MKHPQSASYAVTILKSRQEVYEFWRDWKNLAKFSRHLSSVEDLGGGRTRWTAEGPTGNITWEAETTVDEPGRKIEWKSIEGADVDNNGTVEFKDAPGDRGTEVFVMMQIDQPGGKLGEIVAKLTGNSAEQEIAESTRRFKSILECGELPTVEGQPSNQMRKESKPGDLSKKVGLR